MHSTQEPQPSQIARRLKPWLGVSVKNEIRAVNDRFGGKSTRQILSFFAKMAKSGAERQLDSQPLACLIIPVPDCQAASRLRHLSFAPVQESVKSKLRLTLLDRNQCFRALESDRSEPARMLRGSHPQLSTHRGRSQACDNHTRARRKSDRLIRQICP